MRRYIVILNQKAGAAGAPGETAASAEALQAAFARAGIRAEVHTGEPGALESILRAAIATAPDAIVVGGGDGTVRAAAAALAGSGIALGVLPLGTLNHFAKDLGLPEDLDAAVAALASAPACAVDVGEVNGHVFINNCSLGSYAEAVRRRDALRAREGIGKWRAMARAVFQTFLRLRRIRLRVAVDGEHARALRVPFVFVANNRYSGHLLDKSLRERLDEGRLWLYVAHAHRHLTIVRMFWQALRRRIDATDRLEARPAREIVMETGPGLLPAAADGELIELRSPLRFRIRAGALRVLAPLPART